MRYIATSSASAFPTIKITLVSATSESAVRELPLSSRAWFSSLTCLLRLRCKSILHGECFCHVVECAYGDRSMRAKRRLRRHFQIRHPQDGQNLAEVEECGMQVDRGNRRHRGSQVCRDGEGVRMYREAADKAVQSLEMFFTAYDEATERREEME
eukprot:scaffold13824_cov147-Skeletonema_dohrnii-CCMP3373.AAC.5